MQKYSKLDDFFKDQSLEKLEQINLIRSLILETEPLLKESLKWNAPNYNHNGIDRITFNVMNKEDKVKLIIHMGVSKKENKAGHPVLNNDQGLVIWSSDIRGFVQFENVKDIKNNQIKFKQLITDWLSLN